MQIACAGEKTGLLRDRQDHDSLLISPQRRCAFGSIEGPAPMPDACLADWDVFTLYEGTEASPDIAEWADLFGGIPAPETASFYGLCRFCDAHAAAVDAALPRLAALVGRNDGYATMLGFVHRWSGRRLYVPRSHAQFVERVGCGIGASTHASLVRDAGVGAQVEVPSAWGVFLALRRVAIAVAIRSRLSHDEVARRFGVTLRSLR